MNAVVDVVGFLSFSSDCDDFAYLPASLVPRLHAVSLKLISQRNPFIPTNLDESKLKNIYLNKFLNLSYENYEKRKTFIMISLLLVN